MPLGFTTLCRWVLCDCGGPELASLRFIVADSFVAQLAGGSFFNPSHLTCIIRFPPLLPQFHLHRQLLSASRYAAERGVVLKGDLPIGVSRDSADVWVEPQL